jgi:ubiquinone/menaquinone biosynthesis C-methylase UbiE
VKKKENTLKSAAEFYDDLGVGYELMINWDARLKREAPFFHKLFDEHDVRRVLDCACGTGQHAIEFARWGHDVSACDISSQMLELAEQNVSTAGVQVNFFQSDLSHLKDEVSGKQFDAVVCLGNSLPHLLTQRELDRAIRSIKDVLAPGGIFITQNRNYPRILRDNLRFMPPTSAEWEGRECIFFRMLDIHTPRRIDFHIIRFLREAQGWNYKIQTTRLRPIQKTHIESALKRAGFKKIRHYADYSFTPFSINKTLDLITVAH